MRSWIIQNDFWQKSAVQKLHILGWIPSWRKHAFLSKKQPLRQLSGSSQYSNMQATTRTQRLIQLKTAFTTDTTAVLSEAWAKLRAKLLILPRNIHASLREIGEWEKNFDWRPQSNMDNLDILAYFAILSLLHFKFVWNKSSSSSVTWSQTRTSFLHNFSHQSDSSIFSISSRGGPPGG